MPQRTDSLRDLAQRLLNDPELTIYNARRVAGQMVALLEQEEPAERRRMDMARYQRLAAQTIPLTLGRDDLMDAAIMGLVSELGELVGPWKKHRHQGHPRPDLDGMEEELGDCLWYLSEAATALGLGLDEIAWANVDKLLGKRYPEGYFTPERSMDREEGHA